MSVAAFEHVLPWTEEEFLELGDSANRVELFDGSLFVSPAPDLDHQHLMVNLVVALKPAARVSGYDVYAAVNVRLAPNRIPIPDLVIVKPVSRRDLVVDGSAVRLVGEIVSPSNAATDRVLKMHYYAEAGIAWYLLIERRPELTLQLFRLDGMSYVKHAEGRSGHPLRLTDPVDVVLDPDDLLD